MSVQGELSPQPLFAPLRVRDTLEHVFYNQKLIRNCVLAGLALGLLGAVALRPDRVSDAVVLVEETPQDPTASVSAALAMTAVPKAVQADAAILDSEPVLREAARRVGATGGGLSASVNSILGGADDDTALQSAAARIRKTLRIDTDPGSNLIKVSYANADKEMSVRVLKAVMDSYIAQRREIYTGAATEVQRQEVARYSAQLNDLDSRIKAAQEKFGVLNIAQEVQLTGVRQDNIALRISQVRERAQGVDAELATARSRLARTPDQVFDSREVTNGSPSDDARNLLLRLKQERAHMATQYQPDYPGLKELDERIRVAEAQIARNSQDEFVTARRIRNPDVDTLNTRIATLSLERAGLGRQLAELTAQQGEMNVRVGNLRQGGEELADLQRRREALEAVYRALSLQQAGSRLRDNTVVDPQAAVRVVQPPFARPANRTLPLLLLLAGPIVGLAAAAAWISARGLLRQTFLTPGEVERVVRVPVIGALPADANNQLPENSEAVGQLAAFILDVGGAGEKPLSVVQLAAPGDGQDRGDVALLLAREFVSGFDRKTLLIDTNGELYDDLSIGAQSEASLSVDGVELRIIRTRWAGLWAISQPASEESPFVSARLQKTRAAQMLNELKAQFDQVVVVAPHDFSGYAARRLYPLADAHILTVRSERTRSPALRALREAVLSAGGDILGAVFTRRRFHIPERVYRWTFG